VDRINLLKNGKSRSSQIIGRGGAETVVYEGIEGKIVEGGRVVPEGGVIGARRHAVGGGGALEGREETGPHHAAAALGGQLAFMRVDIKFF